MKRLVRPFGMLVVLMAISSSANAGSYSFVIGGRHIYIEAPRHCRSSSCVSVSSFERKSEPRDQAVTAPVAVPVSPPAQAVAPPPAPACVPAPAPAAVKPAAPIIAAAPPPPPPAAPVLASTTTQQLELPPLPKLEPPPMPKAEITTVSRQTEDDSTGLPLGQWETEGGKGTVRIERCGTALCGYALGEATSEKGESVLVNMKPKSASVWSGSVYSRDTGNTYYASMTLKSPDKLHVEACALGRFFCSGNDWTRIEQRQEKLLATQRQWSGARS